MERKNVVSTKDFGGYIVETRKVYRRGMTKPCLYELKVPKNVRTFISLYGEVELLRMANATLRTESDDSVERKGRPAPPQKRVQKAILGASEEQIEKIMEILGIQNQEEIPSE